MKSIKEKAKEHLNSVYAGYDYVLKELVKESYVSGANYVLDEIECILADKELDCEEICDELVALIEQLKK